MNCTDGSKHDAISASYCYSLNPNIIRHSNTTIMQGARLTSSQLPAACATVSESFVRFGQIQRENIRKCKCTSVFQLNVCLISICGVCSFYLRSSILFFYHVTPLLLPFVELIFDNTAYFERKKRVICTSGRSCLMLAGGY